VAQAEHDAERIAILVLGMHRSGTSALTRLLGYLGAAMPRDSIDPQAENAKGYWEPRALVQVTDRILRTARTSWFDPRPFDVDAIPAVIAAQHRADLRQAIAASFGDAPVMAIKDPRLCRMVELLRPALAEASVQSRAVLMLRHPAEVARSLHARDRSTPAYAYALWLDHLIAAERDSRTMPRVTISYNALLSDWRDAVLRLAPLVGPDVAVPEGPVAHEIEGFLDRGMRHHLVPAMIGLEPFLEAIMSEAYVAFGSLADRDDDAARARIDRVVARWKATPRVVDDIIHDELRHRRVEELRLRDLVGTPGTSAPAPTKIEAPLVAPQPSIGSAADEPSTVVQEERPDTAPLTPLDEQIALVRESGLFDAAWYRERYPEAAGPEIDPIEHYLTIGAAQGYDPSPLFHTVYYARQMARRLDDGAAGAH
jgi:hypothetical protein